MEGEGSPLANIPHPALATTQSFDLPKLFESRAYLYFKGQRGGGGPIGHSTLPAFATASSADAKKMCPSYLSHQFGGFRGKDFLYFDTTLSSQSKNIVILSRLGVQRVHKDMLCNVVQHIGNMKATC